MKIDGGLKNEMKEIAEIVKLFPESVQDKVFDYLISESKADSSNKAKSRKKNKGKGNKGNSRSKSKNKEKYELVKDLDLRGGADQKSFKSFYKEKKPSSGITFNAVALYYLKKVLNVEKVGPNHIFTCYKNVKRRPPSRLIQSLWDTSSSKYGYIDASDVDNLKLPIVGENFVEFELPEKKK